MLSEPLTINSTNGIIDIEIEIPEGEIAIKIRRS